MKDYEFWRLRFERRNTYKIYCFLKYEIIVDRHRDIKKNNNKEMEKSKEKSIFSMVFKKKNNFLPYHLRSLTDKWVSEYW